MRNKLGHYCTVLGILLLLAAIGLWGYNYYDANRADEAAQNLLTEVTMQQSQQTQESAIAKAADDETFLGTLSIPALGLELPVYNRFDDALMKDTVCRYSGAVDTENLVIAGHNYKRHFGKLSDLQQGDEVMLKTMGGNTYTYQVLALETLNATAVDEMTSGEYALTLFTCDYSAMRASRFVVSQHSKSRAAS